MIRSGKSSTPRARQHALNDLVATGTCCPATPVEPGFEAGSSAAHQQAMRVAHRSLHAFKFACGCPSGYTCALVQLMGCFGASANDSPTAVQLQTLTSSAGRDTEAALAELGSHCAAVVICRASPSQKAAIVHMMDEFELRRAGGRRRGWLGWWHRVHYGLKVRIDPLRRWSTAGHYTASGRPIPRAEDAVHCLCCRQSLLLLTSVQGGVSTCWRRCGLEVPVAG